MPTAVSDLTLPKATTAALSTTSHAIATQMLTNGKVVQSEQIIVEQDDKSSADKALKKNEERQFIVKYRQSYFDITRFLKHHPGGINTLRGLNHSDMTTRFLHAPPHSDAAMYLMKEYEIKPTQLPNSIKRRQHLHQKQKMANDVVDMFDDNGIEMVAEDLQEDKNNNQLDESMEYLVDWSKAMLPQISHITHHYDEWVHKPVDRTLRLFGPTYLEVLTKTPWWVIPLFWIPIISKCLWDELAPNWNTTSISTLLFLFAYFACGIFFWTFVEYALHRFVFHMKVSATTNPWLCTFHFMIHGLHHKVPFDPKRLVFPPLPGVVIATIIYAPISFILPQPRMVLAGALFGYLCYDMMHYYLHYGNPSLKHTPFMYDMKRYHYQHHFAHQDIGYGISSPFWDFVFNTRIYLRKLRFPLRWR